MKTTVDLTKTIEDKMIEHQIPGLVVGILHGDEVTVESFGMTNIDHPLEVSAETS